MKIENPIIDLHENAREYYGKQLKTNEDLKTSACCSIDSIPPHHRQYLKKIDDEIMEKFYGCGSPIPPALKGKTVLDLGCGSGRDSYLLSQLVGEKGYVIGVDMTDEQLDVAKSHRDGQMARFGYSEANVDFRKGYIEDLTSVGIADNTIDVVTSNCVINLSPDKKTVFSEIFRVLKPGGELYFSDVYASRRLPESLKNDPLLHGECLGGALYIEDFRRILRDLGCLDYRMVSGRKLTFDDPEIRAKIGNIEFFSHTIRAFKLNTLEDICEDYGQVVRYLGNLEESPHAFELDDHHVFEAGKLIPVCGNTTSMLQETRYSIYFKVIGDRSIHFGEFTCGPSDSSSDRDDNTTSGSCC